MGACTWPVLRGLQHVKLICRKVTNALNIQVYTFYTNGKFLKLSGNIRINFSAEISQPTTLNLADFLLSCFWYYSYLVYIKKNYSFQRILNSLQLILLIKLISPLIVCTCTCRYISSCVCHFNCISCVNTSHSYKYLRCFDMDGWATVFPVFLLIFIASGY